MNDKFIQALWKNFAAAIDMLKQTIILCPDGLWQKDKRFFLLTYHTTIFLDYYLTNPVRDFVPNLPFVITDSSKLPGEAVDDVIPNRLYSKEEVLSYLSVIREKCRKMTIQLTKEKLMEKWIEDDEIDLHGLCPSIVIDYTILDILFYNFRHIQHHVGQLNYILRQEINTASDWIAEAE
jgi:hypothetical protein